MTSRRGFTLIEIMIVLFVLGVAVHAFFSPVQQILGLQRLASRELRRQEAVTVGFAVIREAFRQAQELRWLSADEVLCLGLRDVTVRRAPDGGSVEIITQDGRIHLDFGGGATFGPFHPVDDKTVWGSVILDGAKIPMFWRCGL